jgi:hypothetical protein
MVPFCSEEGTASIRIMKMKKWMIALPFRRQFVMACLWALVVLSAIFIVKAVFSSDYAADSIYLSISLNSPEDGVAALYYDVGKGFNDDHVVFVSIRGGGRVYDYLFKIPNQTIYNLRWNLLLATHRVISFHNMEILDGFRRPIKRLSLSQLEPLHQIRTFALSDAKADFQVQEGANDPQIKIRLDSPLSVKRFSSLFLFVGGLFLEFLGLFLSACLLIYIWFRQKDKVIATVIVITLVFFGWRCWSQYNDARSLFLQVAMSSSVDSIAQVFYDLGRGLNENQSQQMHTTRREDLRQYRFKLPNKKIYDLRFDPMVTGGKVRIGEIRVTDAYGNLLREIPLRQLKPLDQIRTINYKDDGVEIVVPEGANDPKIAIPLKDALNFENKLPFPRARWFLSLMAELVLCVLFAFVFIWAWRRWRNLCLAGHGD